MFAYCKYLINRILLNRAGNVVSARPGAADPGAAQNRPVGSVAEATERAEAAAAFAHKAQTEVTRLNVRNEKLRQENRRLKEEAQTEVTRLNVRTLKLRRENRRLKEEAQVLTKKLEDALSAPAPEPAKAKPAPEPEKAPMAKKPVTKRATRRATRKAAPKPPMATKTKRTVKKAGRKKSGK